MRPKYLFDKRQTTSAIREPANRKIDFFKKTHGKKVTNYAEFTPK